MTDQSDPRSLEGMASNRGPFEQVPLGVISGHAFSRIAQASESAGNAIRLLRDGPVTYPLWLAAIGRARHHVHLENYILQEDELGHAFADALIAAAGRGVRCRVLYDWLGCRSRTSRHFWTALRQKGVEVRCYNPPHLGNPLGWISRDHRKVLCVDGEIAFTGGLCISQDWMGDPARGLPPWRDTAIEIRGPAVAHLEWAFADSWAVAGPALPDAEIVQPEAIARAGGTSLGVIAGRPDSMGLYRLEQLVAEIAQRSLWISDAYFVATTGYARALGDAARAGVDVRILVPGVSNMPLVGSLSRAGYHGLLEAGVRIFEWNGTMMHAKTAVADHCWARVGSSNSNLASWISNRELDVTLFDEGIASALASMFEQDLENATEVTLHGTSARAGQGRESLSFKRRTGSAGRLLAGTVGLSSAIGATIAQHRTVGPAEMRFLTVAGALLLLLVVMAIFIPQLVAYPVAFAALWVAATLFGRAWRLRRLPVADIGAVSRRHDP